MPYIPHNSTGEEQAASRHQATFVNRDTGHSITPTWRHRGCGGTVYMSHEAGHQFCCNHCNDNGRLGAEIPDGLTPDEQMVYMLTQVEEVDLN